MVSRIFEFASDAGGEKRAVVLTIHAPVQTETDWRSAIDITGFPGETCPTMRGEDSMDALLSAVQFADFRLRSLARIHRGKLTLDGSPNLRLVLNPIGWRGRVLQALADLLGESRR